MRETCRECAHLWLEFSDVARRQFRVEERLRRAEFRHETIWQRLWRLVGDNGAGAKGNQQGAG